MERLQKLDIFDQVELHRVELHTFEDYKQLLISFSPDEIYHLAATSSVTQSLKDPLVSGECDALGTLRLLEAVRTCSRHTRVFFASSAEMFTPGDGSPQDETATLGPQSPYACAKVYGFQLCQTYRLAYSVFACSGILFNHESPLRGSQFVTRKITGGLARIRMDGGEPIQLGNLDSRRDWGYAKDFVEAMWLMLQAEHPRDYVLATGTTNSVRDFCELAARAAGFDIHWQIDGSRELGIDIETGTVIFNSEAARFRPNDAPCRIGSPARAVRELGWQPSVRAPDLARLMMEAEMQQMDVRA